MAEVFGFPLLKIVVCAGFAAWSLVAAFNNIVGFAASIAAVVRTTSMAPLREEPTIPTPFDHRAVNGSIPAAVAVIIILILQAAAACLLGAAAASFAQMITPSGMSAADFAEAGFALLTTAWFAMLIAGLWFGYWIRQDILQLTHFALLVATLTAALIVNA